MSIDSTKLLADIVGLVRRASDLVRAAYDRGDARVDWKAPGDPVTDADRAANTLLVDGLAALYPDAAIVGEESTETARGDRASAPVAIFVDPLDGTRDFVDRTGEFAVMVGVTVYGRALVGVVMEPVSGRLFAAAPDEGAFVVEADGTRHAIRVADTRSPKGARLLVSRTRPNAELDALAASLGMASRRTGSAGVKGARVASGEADAFLHFGRAGCLWDAAAVDALVTHAGGRFTDAFGDLVDYRQPRFENMRGVVAANPALHAALVEAIAPVLARGSGEPS